MKPDMESAQRHISDCLEEINRLKAINAELLEALEEALTFDFVVGFNAANPNSTRDKIKAAIANARPTTGRID